MMLETGAAGVTNDWLVSVLFTLFELQAARVQTRLTTHSCKKKRNAALADGENTKRQRLEINDAKSKDMR